VRFPNTLRSTSSDGNAAHSPDVLGNPFFRFGLAMTAPDAVNQTYVRKYEDNYRKAPATLIDVVHRFHSEDVCRDYLEKLRWADGKPNCPRCNSESISEISTRNQFDCNACRCRFSVTAGSIFDNTKLPLWKWFAAVYLMLESKKAISSNQLKRTLGTTYKTAWHLTHRIREAMETVDSGPVLFGIIELDETLLTPRRRYVSKTKRGMGVFEPHEKIWIAGALQRGGQIRLRRIPNTKRATLHAFVNEVARPDTEAFYTDEWTGYLGIADHDTRHETVKHSAEEWVVGDVHTNGIENIWSLFKRSLVGAFHKISVKHLDAYLQEMEFRYNNRHNQHAFRDVMSRLLAGEALRYQKLTA
jgi:transposase-like protein